MMTERLEALRRAEPFVPFTIRMVDGRSHRVDEPEIFNHRPGTRRAVVIGPGGEVWVLATGLIREIEIDPPGDLDLRDRGRLTASRILPVRRADRCWPTSDAGRVAGGTLPRAAPTIGGETFRVSGYKMAASGPMLIGEPAARLARSMPARSPAAISRF